MQFTHQMVLPGARLAQLVQQQGEAGRQQACHASPLLEPIDAALVECADTVGAVQRGTCDGALDDVEAALTICLEVIAQEGKTKAVTGGRCRSRLALWKDQARNGSGAPSKEAEAVPAEPACVGSMAEEEQISALPEPTKVSCAELVLAHCGAGGATGAETGGTERQQHGYANSVCATKATRCATLTTK